MDTHRARSRRYLVVLALCAGCDGAGAKADAGTKETEVDSGLVDSGVACVPAGEDRCGDGLDQDCDGADARCATLTIPEDADLLVPEDADETIESLGAFPGGLLVGTSLNRVYTWRGPVSGSQLLSASARIVSGGPRDPRIGMVAAAYGDDGGFVTGEYGSGVFLYQSEGAEPVLTFDQPEFDWARVAVGEFTGDGTLDFAFNATDCSGGPGDARVTEVVDGSLRGIVDKGLWTAALAPAHYTDWEFGCFDLAGAGDTDGDGNDEIVVNGQGTELMFRGPLAGLLLEPDADATLTGRPSAAPDVDGDGLADLVLRDSKEAVVVRARTDGQLGADVIGRAICPAQYEAWDLGPIAIGDFNRDGALDLAIGVQPDFIWIAHGPLEGTVDCRDWGQIVMVGSEWPPLDGADLTAVDLDGDAMPELALMQTGAEVSILGGPALTRLDGG